jgi:hypothetical protein
MPDKFPPSEFGGKGQRNTIQPPVTPRGHAGHSPTESERLRLQYLTGQDEDSTRDPDGGEAFTGLLPEEEARELVGEPEKYLD